MERKIGHLQMIQDVINRMAGNSFYLKGWAVTLVAALLAISIKEWDTPHFLVAILAIGVFWCLDSYYLQLERKYRSLYEHVRFLGEEEVDFSMNVAQVEVTVKDSKKLCYLSCLSSISELWFYLLLVLAVVVLYFLP